MAEVKRSFSLRRRRHYTPFSKAAWGLRKESLSILPGGQRNNENNKVKHRGVLDKDKKKGRASLDRNELNTHEYVQREIPSQSDRCVGIDRQGGG